MVEYKNRYGDVYTFTQQDNGNILWEGNFEYCRIGYPNDYNKAYNAYVADGGKLSFNEFKQSVHEWDDETNTHYYPKYVTMIESVKDKIDMVDPSGGPYLQSGQDAGTISPQFKGKLIKEFKRFGTGYEIILW